MVIAAWARIILAPNGNGPPAALGSRGLRMPKHGGIKYEKTERGFYAVLRLRQDRSEQGQPVAGPDCQHQVRRGVELCDKPHTR